MTKEWEMKSLRMIAGFVSMAVCALLVPSPALSAPGLPGVKDFYLLNVHAYDNCPNGDYLDSNRRMIAVKAYYTYNPSGEPFLTMPKTNTISLVPGDDFSVLDGNACNKGGAVFQLPSDVATKYEVYVRLVGKPGTGIDVTSCADEAADLDGDGIVEDVVMCSTESVVETRGTGKPVAVKVTSQLLTLCLDLTGDGVCDRRFNLFAPELENYFWQWNTTGQAKAQLIFVPIN
jgi:hypothetical protein